MPANKKSKRGGNLGDAREVRAIKRSASSDSENGGSDEDHEEEATTSAGLFGFVLQDAMDPAAEKRKRDAREWQQRSRSAKKAAEAATATGGIRSYFGGASSSAAASTTPAATATPRANASATPQATAAATTTPVLAMEAVMMETVAMEAAVAAIEQAATPSGLSVNGKKIGRPRKDATTTTTSANPSHRGASSSSLGSSTHESKETRAEARRTRSAAAQLTSPPPKQQRVHAGQPQPRLLPKMTDDARDALKRMSASRRLERAHVVGGKDVPVAEWLTLRDDRWELRRVYAMAHWVTLRESGMEADDAAATAAASVLMGEGAKPLTARTVLDWLRDYVRAGARIALSQRGRNVNTESYLADEKLKAKAVDWLRDNVQAARSTKPKPGEHPTPPLTVHRFCQWINDKLLAKVLREVPSRKPIVESTACRWLHALGYRYCENKKNIYMDGHERPDVVMDRKEKLVMLHVLKEVTVTFSGDNCEIVNWPDGLHPGEPPLVDVSQDECAYHANDDCPWEWCKGDRQQIKQKSRGSLMMISEFLSEHAGRLCCSKAEAIAYAAAHPDSLIASKVAAGRAEEGLDARLILEPGANKDAYFDNEQLLAQTKYAKEIFDAMGRHVAPAREVKVSDSVDACVEVSADPDHPVRLRLSPRDGGLKQLPAVRCIGLFLFDHSSGHDAGATDARSVNTSNKGPDWTGKVVPQRDGYYPDPRGPSYPRLVQRMQFAEGDLLPCDVIVPNGIDANAAAGAAATIAPAVLPEQLIGRAVAYDSLGLQHAGKVSEVEGDRLVVEFGDGEDDLGDYLFSVEEVLSCLVGPPPSPEQHQQGPPTLEEEAEARKLYFNGRRGTLKKKHPAADGAALRKLADDEWPTLPEERRLHFVRKVRAARDGGEGTSVAARTLKVGEPVPRLLWGRHKGHEALLAERGLLPEGGLRATCPTEGEHRRDHRCCCKRLLGSQPDFRSECSALERVVESGHRELVGPHGTVTVGHRCLFLPKYHCELNWIERYWGASKKYARRHCGYSLTALRVTVPIALSQTCNELPEELRDELDLPVSPLLKMRRWARISRMYRAQYRLGANGHEAVRVVKAQKRHRDTSDARSRQQEAAMEALAFVGA